MKRMARGDIRFGIQADDVTGPVPAKPTTPRHDKYVRDSGGGSRCVVDMMAPIKLPCGFAKAAEPCNDVVCPRRVGISMNGRTGFGTGLIGWLLAAFVAAAQPCHGAILGEAANPQADIAAAVMAQTAEPAAAASVEDASPAAKMARRFPQKVKVGDLIGLPILDDDDVTLGHVQQRRAQARGQDQADRVLQQMVRLVRPAGRGADRGRRHPRQARSPPSTCSRPNTRQAPTWTAGHGCADPGRRDHPHRRDAALNSLPLSRLTVAAR